MQITSLPPPATQKVTLSFKDFVGSGLTSSLAVLPMPPGMTCLVTKIRQVQPFRGTGITAATGWARMNLSVEGVTSSTRSRSFTSRSICGTALKPATASTTIGAE